ncbi:MAG: hypothetical protein ACAH88_02805 [Roseimicrobium sp.]
MTQQTLAQELKKKAAEMLAIRCSQPVMSQQEIVEQFERNRQARLSAAQESSELNSSSGLSNGHAEAENSSIPPG